MKYISIRKNKSWKYERLADEMIKIHKEDECNSDYGRVCMYQAFQFKKELGEIDIYIPSERTVRSVMEQISLIHKPHRKPNGITKADKEARKSDDLIKRISGLMHR